MTRASSRWTALLAGSMVIALLAASCVGFVAETVARAPNHGQPPAPEDDPSPADLARLGIARQFRVEVGPPAASLAVWVLEPSAAPGPPRATLLVLHGWHRRAKAGMLTYGRTFAAAGYRVVLVDLRGHGRSSGEWLTYGIQEAQDLVQLIDALEAGGLVAGKLGVFGMSYGGATAIRLAARDERVSAVVSVAAFGSLREAVDRGVRLYLPGWGWFAGESSIREALERAGRLAGFDAVAADTCDAISRTRVPVLIIHGTWDLIVPVEHARRLHAAAGGPCELVLLDCTGHDAVFHDSTGAVKRESGRWFKRWLDPEPAGTGRRPEQPLP